MLTCLPLRDTDSPLHYVDSAILCNKGTRSVGLIRWTRVREVLCMRGAIPCEHPWEVTPDVYVFRILKRLKRKSRSLLEKAMTTEEFRVNGLLQFTAVQPEVTGWSEGVRRPLCLPRSSLLKTGVLSLLLKTGLQLPLLRPLDE